MRVARPTTNLGRIREFYEDAVGLRVLWSFVDHDGFDGVIFGFNDESAQLEFVRTPHGTAPRPTAEDVLVIYCSTAGEAEELVVRLRSMGAAEVAVDDPELNPYWPRNGASAFVDPDGYRLVIAIA